MTKRVLAVTAVALAIGGASLWWNPALAFDPQPDPPAFGVISARPGETIQLHAVCSEHGAAGIAPRACAAQMMIHDTTGEIVAKQDIRLRVGEAATLEYTVDPSRAGGRVGIVPCIIPTPLSGRLLPTAQLLSETGETILALNPVAPRLSFIKDAMER
jgi:hypothetical protein